MKLYEAIKEIKNLKGANIIADSSLLNYLNDYHAFDERPAAKLVLRDIINGGYSEKILQLIKENTSREIKLKSFEHDFVDSCGYKEELVLYVFRSLAYGIGLTDRKPGEGMDEVLDFHPFFDEPLAEKEQQKPKSVQPKKKSDSVDEKDYLKIAEDFIQNGKLDTARSIAERIANSSATCNPNTIKATLMLGHIMRKKGQYKEALDYYNQALNDEANYLHIEAKELQRRISAKKVKDFIDVDLHYMYCLLGIGHIDKVRWSTFIKDKAAKGNVTAMLYCAQFGIDPQNHIDVFFSEYSKLQYGDYLFEDGTFSHEDSEEKRLIGRVFSLDTSDVEKKMGWTHGRIFAYFNWQQEKKQYPAVPWGESKDLPFPHTHYTSDDLNHLDKINSQLFSELLIQDQYSLKGNAFYAARNWPENIPLTNTSQWYLPNWIQAKDIAELSKLSMWTSSQMDKESAIFLSISYIKRYSYVNLSKEKKDSSFSVVPIFSF